MHPLFHPQSSAPTHPPLLMPTHPSHSSTHIHSHSSTFIHPLSTPSQLLPGTTIRRPSDTAMHCIQTYRHLRDSTARPGHAPLLISPRPLSSLWPPTVTVEGDVFECHQLQARYGLWAQTQGVQIGQTVQVPPEVHCCSRTSTAALAPGLLHAPPWSPSCT